MGARGGLYRPIANYDGVSGATPSQVDWANDATLIRNRLPNNKLAWLLALLDDLGSGREPDPLEVGSDIGLRHEGPRGQRDLFHLGAQGAGKQSSMIQP